LYLCCIYAGLRKAKALPRARKKIKTPDKIKRWVVRPPLSLDYRENQEAFNGFLHFSFVGCIAKKIFGLSKEFGYKPSYEFLKNSQFISISRSLTS
jgi:hypothetical protein